MVVILDPPILIDPDWSLYNEGLDGELFVMDRQRQMFTGTSWAGDAHYPDFSNPHARAWYAKCFSLDRYKVSVKMIFRLTSYTTLVTNHI